MKRFVFLICLFSSVSVWATPPTQADLRHIENQIRQEQRAGEISGRKAAELSGEVKSVQKQMIRLAKSVQEKEDDLTRLENRFQQMTDRQKELEARLALTDKQIVQVVTGFQTLALRPPELALLHVKTPLDTLRSRMLMGYSLPIVQSSNRQIRSDLSELSRLKSDIQAQMVRIKSTRTQLTEQSSQMDRLLQQKSMLQAQYQVSQAQSRERVKNLATQAKDLKDLLEQLERDKKQAAQAALQRVQNNRPSFRQPVSQPTASFAKARGRLPYPIRGQITGHFGDEMIGGAHAKGITITGRPAARVIAPFDGTVLFAGPFKNYGQLVILDHGNGYLTLLAGMDSINPIIGQQVLAGEPIGQVKNIKPNLYIEIRQDGQAIDPMPWFSKNS